MIVKICGIARPQDAEAAVGAGADWIGINFWPQSKRYCDVSAAEAVTAAARGAGDVVVVGVFVNQDERHLREVIDRVGLDRVQLHGDETPEQCAPLRGCYVKAIALGSPDDVARIDAYDCDVVLVDTPSAGYGGSGRTGDWSLAASAVGGTKRILLAGGLTADNVADAVRAVNPWGVDVAGGVEAAPGVKDTAKMAAFVRAAKTAI